MPPRMVYPGPPIRRVAFCVLSVLVTATAVVGCEEDCNYYCFPSGSVAREFTYPREAVAVNTSGEGCHVAQYTCDDTPVEAECTARLTPAQAGTCTIEVEFANRVVSGSVELTYIDGCCAGRYWGEENFDDLLEAGLEF